MLSLVFVLASIGVSRASPLQQAIDKAPSGAVIALGPGFYEGNIAISKPLTLRASGKGVVIHGDGTGSVITVTASYVTVDGLTIENSGPKHQTVDAGITVRGADNVKILRNRIRDCLFGINFEQTNRSVIEDNDITSLPVSLGLKGDGIRLWYSHGNLIRMNRTRYVRDNVFWYSSANKIYENSGADSRYSLHFMYADRNEILSNDYRRNSVGIFLMFSQGSTLKRNFVADSTGPFGIGIGMKESSDILVEENQILYTPAVFIWTALRINLVRSIPFAVMRSISTLLHFCSMGHCCPVFLSLMFLRAILRMLPTIPPRVNWKLIPGAAIIGITTRVLTAMTTDTEIFRTSSGCMRTAFGAICLQRNSFTLPRYWIL